MPAVLRACAVALEAGVHCVAIGGEAFLGLGRAVSKVLGISAVPIVGYPGVILADDATTFESKVRDEVWPAVLHGLIDASPEAAGGVADAPTYSPRRIVASGSLEAIQHAFEQQGFTDGLPIIPPTISAVERALVWAGRPHDEILGIFPSSGIEATVWNVAVNGVMAGCAPEYLPVLIATVEAILDPVFHVEDAGSTPGWEPLIVISGPMANSLGFNSGTGAMRVGRRANTSIGRFLRLYLRNVAGLRIPPWETDQAAIGASFNVVLAEDDDVVASLGWDSHRVERGFRQGDTVVTVRSVVNISAPIYSSGGTAEEHLRTIADLMQNAIGPWFYTGLLFNSWYPLVVVGPAVAQVIARDGLDKNDIRRYLHENMFGSPDVLEAYAKNVGTTDFHVPDTHRSNKGVRLSVRQEWTDIIVAGSRGRNQSRAYIQNHAQGVPVTKLVHATTPA